MVRRKIFLIIGLLILLIGVPLGIYLVSQSATFRLGAQDPNQPENVQVANINQNSAKISWTTPQAAQSLISYGLSTNNLTLIQSESTPTTNHQVTLLRLRDNSRYFFVIKVGQKTYTDEDNQPYNLTTLSKVASPIPSPTTPVLSETGLKAAMGTSNTSYDLNKDGIVNFLDLQLFRR